MSDELASSFRLAAYRQIQRASGELNRTHLKGMLEAVIFAAPTPLSLRELTRLTRAQRGQVVELLEEIAGDYAERGIQLHEIRGGYTFLTHSSYGALVRQVTGKKPVRMSRAQLETLAIIAYRQPVTRPEIDEVRGVDSGPVLRTLLDRELIRVLGKKEEPGRPLLYGTTDAFLTLLGLTSLADLPTLREFTELSDDSRDTYERRLGEAAPTGSIEFDDEPDEPIDPTEMQAGDADENAPASSAPNGAAGGEDDAAQHAPDGEADQLDDDDLDDEDLDDEEEDDLDDEEDDLDDEEDDLDDEEDDLDDEEDDLDDEESDDLDDEEDDLDDDEDAPDDEEDDEDEDDEDDLDDEEDDED